MMKRLAKIRLGGSMAAIAQLRLALHQQMLRFFGVVWRVTIQATHFAAGVGGLREMCLFVFFGVATQAVCA